MKRAAEKLHSQRGATIMMALLYMLVCLIVGSIILTYASVNLSRYQAQKQTQDDMNALTAAAAIMKTELKSSEDSAGKSATLARAQVSYSENNLLQNLVSLTNDEVLNGQGTTATMGLGVNLGDVTVTAMPDRIVRGEIETRDYDDDGNLSIGEQTGDKYGYTYLCFELSRQDAEGKKCASMYLEFSLDTVLESDYTYTVHDVVVNNGGATFNVKDLTP